MAELEDLLEVNRVDLVILPEADPFLALEVIRGELLYSEELDRQAGMSFMCSAVPGTFCPSNSNAYA
jgi:hypothetical protein